MRVAPVSGSRISIGPEPPGPARVMFTAAEAPLDCMLAKPNRPDTSRPAPATTTDPLRLTPSTK